MRTLVQINKAKKNTYLVYPAAGRSNRPTAGLQQQHKDKSCMRNKEEKRKGGSQNEKKKDNGKEKRHGKKERQHENTGTTKEKKNTYF